MCNPLIAVAALSAVGAVAGAQSQRASAKYQSQVAANNAKTSALMAKDALERGNTAAQAQRRKGEQSFGAQRAALAARGLDISEGSALSILEDTAYFNQVDEATVRDNAAREAWGYRNQGGNYQAQSRLMSATASNINPLLSGATAGLGTYAGGGGEFGAGGSLMTAGTAVNRKWYGSSARLGEF